MLSVLHNIMRGIVQHFALYLCVYVLKIDPWVLIRTSYEKDAIYSSLGRTCCFQYSSTTTTTSVHPVLELLSWHSMILITTSKPSSSPWRGRTVRPGSWAAIDGPEVYPEVLLGKVFRAVKNMTGVTNSSGLDVDRHRLPVKIQNYRLCFGDKLKLASKVLHEIHIQINVY